MTEIIEVTYTKPVDVGALVEELRVAGVTDVTGNYDGTTVTLAYPGTTNPQTVDGIVAAHDPNVEQIATRNAATMKQRATAALANLDAAAAALDAGTATAAQQRAALALCCRTTARLVRLVLDELDTAD